MRERDRERDREREGDSQTKMQEEEQRLSRPRSDLSRDNSIALYGEVSLYGRPPV